MKQVLDFFATLFSYSSWSSRWRRLTHNTSERRKKNQQSTKEKTLSDLVMDSLPGIFYLFNKNGKYLKWNHNLELVTGYSADEISKMHPLDFFDGHDKKVFRVRINEVFIKGSTDAQAHLLTKNGQRIPYYFTGNLIQYEGEPCLIGIGLDITDRIKAEEKAIAAHNELKDSEEKYRELFHNNPLPMLMIDIETLNIIDVNEAAMVHYGYSRNEFVSMNIREIRPKDEIQKMEALSRIKNPGVRKIGIVNHLKKDGTIIKMEITSHDVNYQHQRTRLILANDVTDKVKAEEQLLKVNDELRQLYARQQHIREEERKHIAREIHDELGQLITGLKMDISWLKKKIIAKQPELTDKLNETIGLLDDSVKTIRKISSELRPGILDDLGVVDALAWVAKDFERRTSIKCVIHIPEEEIKCNNEAKVVMFRIFQETLTNVMRHAKATEVVAEISKDAHALTMQVSDNGKGFDAAIQTKTLGLLGMKERMINIKGELYISSAVGRGTTVTIIIPI